MCKQYQYGVTLYILGSETYQKSIISKANNEIKICTTHPKINQQISGSKEAVILLLKPHQ